MIRNNIHKIKLSGIKDAIFKARKQVERSTIYNLQNASIGDTPRNNN